MAVVTKQQHCIAVRISGKHSRPCGLGNFVLGYSRIGMDDVFAGIYQMRYRLHNDIGQGYNKKLSKIMVLEKYYWPSNVYTRPQHSYCAKFRDAMIAWGALTKEEQLPWNIKGRKLYTRGNALFVKAYMLDRELKP